MKILMLTPYLPFPPSSGGQIRSYNLIKRLSKNHEITLYSLIKDQREKEYVKELQKYCQQVKVYKRPQKPWTVTNILKTAVSLYPFLVIRNYSPEEKKDIARILKEDNFDIIHAETFYVSPHIPKTHIPIVLVDQTIEYQVYQHFVENFKWKVFNPFLGIDVLKIKFWETYYWKKAARVVAVSERDAKVMKGLVKGVTVTVVPNGVGDDLIKDVPPHFSHKILFMGNYAWLQNIEAARILSYDVFPKILSEVPDAKLIIAGQNTIKIKDLANDHIELLDLKIEDIDGVKKAYCDSGVLVAPLYGPGGTRLKILGAMASRLPVVTTSIGIEGIEAKIGESVFCGNTPSELAKLTVKLLKDEELYNKIANNARALIEEKYTYESISTKLDAVYQEVRNG